MSSNIQLTWPVIVNVSLSNSEVCRLLEKNHKMRVSDTTGEDTVIFPLSSVAFLLLNSSDIMTRNDDGNSRLDANIMKRIERFQQIHRNCYVIVTSNMMSAKQLQCLVALQERFSQHLGFIPVCNSKESVNCMTNIAKVTCKPLSNVIKERLQNLQSSTIIESVVLHILSNLGLTLHDILLILHILKSCI
ncbi:hypothetical protein QZH41_014109 [Actinostola sp. cb2023]|nr:hypothetical protein QZH41_014109 [Actinostola sp. cb2023]